MKSFTVIGMGLFGTQMAMELFNAGYQVLAVDKKMDRIEDIADHVSRAVCLDAKDREAMMEAGVNHYDTAIVSTTEDLSATILIAMNLKSMGISKIICKAKNHIDESILETIGEIEIIIPENVAAEKICQKIIHPGVVEYTKLSDQYDIVEIPIPRAWAGHTIADLDVRAKFGVNIIAIRSGEIMNVNLNPHTPLCAGDTMTIIVGKKQLEKLLQRL